MISLHPGTRLIRGALICSAMLSACTHTASPTRRAPDSRNVAPADSAASRPLRDTDIFSPAAHSQDEPSTVQTMALTDTPAVATNQATTSEELDEPWYQYLRTDIPPEELHNEHGAGLSTGLRSPVPF